MTLAASTQKWYEAVWGKETAPCWGTGKGDEHWLRPSLSPPSSVTLATFQIQGFWEGLHCLNTAWDAVPRSMSISEGAAGERGGPTLLLPLPTTWSAPFPHQLLLLTMAPEHQGSSDPTASTPRSPSHRKLTLPGEGKRGKGPTFPAEQRTWQENCAVMEPGGDSLSCHQMKVSAPQTSTLVFPLETFPPHCTATLPVPRLGEK